MGTEIGEFAENTVLFEAACNPDPVLRLAGVNRALEGLAIDVFTTMKEFGDIAGDPFLEFCEDWMLADEVTHVKMGSDWLRTVTENDPSGASRRSSSRASSTSCSHRRHPRRERRVADRARPPVPRAGRLHRDEIDEIAAALRGGAARGRREAARGSASGRRRQSRRHDRHRQPQTFTFVELRRGGDRDDRGRRCSISSGSPIVDVEIEVDETSPLGRAHVVSQDPVVIEAESGAFEDPKRPRQLSPAGTADVLGRVLLRVRRPSHAGLRRTRRPTTT